MTSGNTGSAIGKWLWWKDEDVPKEVTLKDLPDILQLWKHKGEDVGSWSKLGEEYDNWPRQRKTTPIS